MGISDSMRILYKISLTYKDYKKNTHKLDQDAWPKDKRHEPGIFHIQGVPGGM